LPSPRPCRFITTGGPLTPTEVLRRPLATPVSTSIAGAGCGISQPRAITATDTSTTTAMAAFRGSAGTTRSRARPTGMPTSAPPKIRRATGATASPRWRIATPEFDRSPNMAESTTASLGPTAMAISGTVARAKPKPTRALRAEPMSTATATTARAAGSSI
jgi:hypothetical protein